MGAIHKPRKFQYCEIQNREIQEVAVIIFQSASLSVHSPASTATSLISRF